MATENNNKILNVPNKREQNQTCLGYAEREGHLHKENVPNLRFPEFNGEWNVKRLDECVTFLDEQRKPIKSTERSSEYKLYPYYGASGVIDYVDDYIFNEELILLSEDGANILDRNYRVAFIVKGKTWVNNHAHVLRPMKNVDISYLSEYLESLKYEKYNTGSTMPKLNQEVCRSIKILLPEYAEQVKIGILLSAINERIATQIKIIEKLESLIKGIYERLFNIDGAAYIQLGNVAKIHKGQQINGEELSETGSYYVMNGGVVPSGYLEDFNTPANTISISEGGNSCGYVQYNGVPFWSGGHCYTLIDPITSFNYKYLFHYLKFKEQSIMALRIGSGLPNIQKKDLDSFPILNISKEEQNTIACVFDEILEKIVCERQIALKYEEQKRYLLSNLFI